jgi:hypothetical protein
MAMMNKLKKKLDNAFNAAAKRYDELRASVPDYVPVSAIGVFVVELGKELIGKNQPKGTK